jgi:Ca2+/H+ antiporter
VSASVQTRGRSSRHSALVNAVAATAFLIGGSLFALGAALAQAGVDPTACATIYLIGGVFFSAGGYTSVLQVVNEPGADGAPPARWRWWSREPRRLQWLSAVVLFAGTIVFAINLVDSFIAELSPAAANRLVWSPDMVGCALFLVSGHLAMAGIAGRFWSVWRRRDLGWWIIAVNQLGSVLFMVSAVASFVSASGDELSTGIANWGTLLGAVCFGIAGGMQEFEHPLGPRRRRDQAA